MKVLLVDQIRDLDAYTITNEPIQSIDLMERAASTCTTWIMEHLSSYDHAVIICGSGNNGGDGLVIARQLAALGWKIQITFPKFSSASADFSTNLARLQGIANVQIIPLDSSDGLPNIPETALVVDALFGSGLTRPLEGIYEEWVSKINELPNLILSIDIPSGLFADKMSSGISVHADFTLSFEVPKLAFLVPETQESVGEWVVLSIGLDQTRLAEMDAAAVVIEESDVCPLLKSRHKFDHKGIFGHALLVVGSYGKAGAAILASSAALRSGTGLVTAHVPGKLNPILQTALPELMIDTDQNASHFSEITETDAYSAIGIGCGIGVHEETISAMDRFLSGITKPIVLDADALNCIATKPEMLKRIPSGSILTPHFKEFERIFGASTNHFERLELLRSAAISNNLHIVLKGAHTAIATPGGQLYFNTTGNPGMATAGSGDVLTGIITGLLAQHYEPLTATLLGVYLHGLAGDIAADIVGYEALIAGDIIDHLGDAFIHLHEATYEDL